MVSGEVGPVQSIVDSKSDIVDTSPDVCEDTFTPFITEGFVSIVGDSHLQPIKILRDTGAYQSLILEDVLPFSEKSSIGASALISGVGGIVSVPLHKICLQSDLVSGPVTVGVKPSLPVEGVSMLLGNDSAGRKVVPEVHVVETPISDLSTEQLNEEFTNIYTRYQKRSQESKEDCSLSDTFISHVDEISDSTSR